MEEYSVEVLVGHQAPIVGRVTIADWTFGTKERFLNFDSYFKELSIKFG